MKRKRERRKEWENEKEKVSNVRYHSPLELQALGAHAQP